MKYSDLDAYIRLIRSFLKTEIAVTEFERRYLTLFKNDATNWGQKEYEVLNGLFLDVDAFCADPKLRRSGHIDEPKLRKQCETALKRLTALNAAFT